jgi:hypothetical protein
MAIETKHPLYADHLPDWQLLKVAYKGERAVKEMGTLYLKPTSGMLADGMDNVNQLGYKAYEAYRQRAVFPEFMAESVTTCMGMLWYKPPVIKLPRQLEPLMQRASVKGETMHQLLRRVHEQQLTVGRCGLLLDLPETVPVGTPILPYMALYEAENIINWDDGRTGAPMLQTLNLVVLNETELVRSGFTWTEEPRYRVLFLGDRDTNQPIGDYQVEVQDAAGVPTRMSFAPMYLGKKLDEIPFVFVNSKDLLPDPDVPPLMALARLCMSIYRSEADYRQNLFMQGQDTLVISGAEGETADGKQTRVGSGAILHLPTGAKAEYVGVNSKGLAEQRAALENDKRLAASRSGQLVDTTSRQRESGDALQTRVAAQTATLSDIAITAAGGLERMLKMAAKWIGADPEEVKVEPNLDFVNAQMTSRNIVELQTAKGLGAPISQKTIHTIMKQRQLTEHSFEEEIALIKKEEPLVEPPDPADGGNNGPGAKKQSGTSAGSGRGQAGV